MNQSFTVLTYTLLVLTILYIVNYILILSSNCNKISDSEEITEKECCEDTWARIDSSVILTLILIAIGLLLLYIFINYFFY